MMAGYPWGLCEAILAATHKGEARSVRRRSRRSRSHTPSGTNCISSPAASPTRPMAYALPSLSPLPTVLIAAAYIRRFLDLCCGLVTHDACYRHGQCWRNVYDTIS
uniref:Uncharacterized protein n=1 Tax=Zea mays TaxID=4577 RepID=B6U373_MAIZE|nr:hypothetical protein [Zea mays]